MANRPIVAVDIGTTTMRMWEAEICDDRLMIVNGAEGPSSGIKKSEVIDLDHAVTALRTVYHQAEEKTGTNIATVHLSVAGKNIIAVNRRGSTHLLEEGPVTEADIRSVGEMARGASTSQNREILHSLHQRFYLDGHGVQDPIGMTCRVLEEDVLIVDTAKTPLTNLANVVLKSNLDVEDVAFSGLCAAMAVLSAEQKQNGVLVIDLGGGGTTYISYADMMITHAGGIAVGGEHVTSDIMQGFKIPHKQAEKLKRLYGNAVVRPEDRTQTVTLPQDNSFGGRTLRQTAVNSIINARVDELFRIIRKNVEVVTPFSKFGSGVVLTGGGANLKGICDIATAVFETPCMVGKPRDVSGLTSIIRGPEDATVVGMLKCAQRTSVATGRGWLSDIFKKIFNR